MYAVCCPPALPPRHFFPHFTSLDLSSLIEKTTALYQSIPELLSALILKEISPGISLEGMMLKLKFQYFGHLMRRVGKVIGKDSDAGRDWGQEEKVTTEDEMAGWRH